MTVERISHFTLVSKRVPVIEDNNIVIDSQVGGIKLTYKEEIFRLVHILRKFRFESLFPIKVINRVYLKPYKSIWDTSRHRLPKNHWGKKDYPLTNLWLELDKDYDFIGDEAIIMIDHQIKSNELIRYLNKTTEYFTIINQKSKLA